MKKYEISDLTQQLNKQFDCKIRIKTFVDSKGKLISQKNKNYNCVTIIKASKTISYCQ